MNVLFISRKWPPAVGGMETYGQELSNALSELPDVNLRVLFLPGRPDGRPPHPISIALFFVRSAWHLFTRRGHYDVVHYGDMVQIGLAWFGRLCSPRTTQVIALHGLDVIYGRRAGFMPRAYRLYMDWARKRSAVDCFLANSRNTASLLEEEGFGPSAVIPLAVAIDESRQRLPIEPADDPPYVLFFGRIFRRKGPRWFAESVLPLLPTDMRFVVVGSVWDKDDGRFLQEHPRVHMPGAFPIDFSAEDFESMKRRAVAIVMPNVLNPDGLDVEGFGLTALEASDNGAPLIASDTEGIRDAVVHGETGFLEPPEDAQAWAKRIIELASWSHEQRQDFSSAAAAVLRDKYSWSRVATDSLAVYQKYEQEA